MTPCRDDPHCPWHQRARLALRRSLRWRLVLVFLVLALALAVTFIGGVQKALSVGWRAAARPLLVDYVDRLAQEVGSPPSIVRAQALVQRLPITIRIEGPQVNWASHPELPRPAWVNGTTGREPPWRNGDDQNLLRRTTADGHRLEFGLHVLGWEQRPRIAWVTRATPWRSWGCSARRRSSRCS